MEGGDKGLADGYHVVVLHQDTPMGIAAPIGVVSFEHITVVVDVKCARYHFQCVECSLLCS